MTYFDPNMPPASERGAYRRRSEVWGNGTNGHRHRPEDDRSLGELFNELADETKMLIRHEIQLAKIEAGEKASEAGRNAAFMGAGGFVAYGGFLAVVGAVAALMATFMPVWLALLITGVLVIGGGYALIETGRQGLKKIDFSLERTTRTLEEDKRWIEDEAQQVKDDPMNMGATR
jgi:hypothetical protein